MSESFNVQFLELVIRTQPIPPETNEQFEMEILEQRSSVKLLTKPMDPVLFSILKMQSLMIIWSEVFLRYNPTPVMSLVSR